jgi:hypothetical protein
VIYPTSATASTGLLKCEIFETTVDLLAGYQKSSAIAKKKKYTSLLLPPFIPTRLVYDCVGVTERGVKLLPAFRRKELDVLVGALGHKLFPFAVAYLCFVRADERLHNLERKGSLPEPLPFKINCYSVPGVKCVKPSS